MTDSLTLQECADFTSNSYAYLNVGLEFSLTIDNIVLKSVLYYLWPHINKAGSGMGTRLSIQTSIVTIGSGDKHSNTSKCGDANIQRV